MTDQVPLDLIGKLRNFIENFLYPVFTEMKLSGDTAPPVLDHRGPNREEQAIHQQLGAMDAGGSVMRAATPAANNVNLLVNMMLLNYMALNGSVTPGDMSNFIAAFPLVIHLVAPSKIHKMVFEPFVTYICIFAVYLLFYCHIFFLSNQFLARNPDRGFWLIKNKKQ